MKVWRDQVIIDKCSLPLLWFSISFAIGLIFIYMGTELIIKHYDQFSISELIIMSVFLLYVLYMLYCGLGFLFEGRKVIKIISLKENDILVENALSQKIKIKNKNILSTDITEKKWLILKPSFFRENSNILNIIVKNGDFLRVSPHMERIEELKVALEEIIRNNKKV